MSVNTCKEQTQESTRDRRNSPFPSVYSSHKTLLWYVSPSDLLNCDLPGSMPCPLNEHVHWNTGWGRASTIWTNTSAEEFWLSPFPKWSLHCDQKQKCKGFWDTFELETIVICPLASVERRILSLSFSGHCAQLKVIIKAILTFFSSCRCIFGSLCFEMLNWPSRAPLNASAIIKARQAIDWTPVNSAPLHILSSPSQCPTRYWMPPRPSLGPPLSDAAICTFPWLALSTAVWERGMGGRRGRWGRTSKCVQFRTWAGMIKNGDCLHCTSHMGPLVPLPLDFLPILPISLHEITAWPELLGGFSLLYIAGLLLIAFAAAHSFLLFKNIFKVFLKCVQLPVLGFLFCFISIIWTLCCVRTLDWIDGNSV